MWKLLCLLICVIVVVKAQNSCPIKLRGEIKGFAPVILTSTPNYDYKLFKPTGKVTNLKHGNELLLACTGKKNFFNNTAFDMMHLTCSQGNFVDSNDNVQPLGELACQYIPASSMLITNKQCAHGNGIIYEIGFTVKHKFYGPIFEICYSNLTETTFYTHSTLNGAAMDYSIPEKTRRPFTADGMMFTTGKTNFIYQKKNQIERFEYYFGPNQPYVNANNFVARGHLAADADFIFGYEQLATYYYANVAPEFQAVNAGNWLRVEEMARAISAAYKDDIESYTSYMGTVALAKQNGDLVQVYLDNTKKFVVPKYYFKILIHKPSDAGIVFLTVNNPFIKDGPAEEICKNICKASGFTHSSFSNVRKGYTFCCDLREFRTVVDTLPGQVRAKYLLKRRI